MSQSIARYLNVRQAYYPGWTDNDRAITFLTDMTGVPQVWRTERPATAGAPLWPDQLTFEADRVLGVWPSPVPGDNRLIYARDSGGDENALLYLLDPDGETESLLTPSYTGVMHTFGAWSPDGTQILFAANRRHRGRFDLYLQPIGGEARLVWQNDAPGSLSPQTFAPDGRHAAIVRGSSSFQHELFEVDLEAGTVRQLSPAGEEARYDALWYAPDGRTLWINTDRGSDFLYVGRLDLETLAVEPLITDSWDLEVLTQSPDGRHLAYAVNEEGSARLELYDVVSGTRRRAPTVGDAPGLAGWLDGHLAFSTSSAQLAFSYISATRVSNIYVWDLATDHITAVTRSSHAGLGLSEFVAPELIHYPTFDDLQIPAWLYTPRVHEQRLPAVVVVHGGPEGQSVPAFNFLVQYLIGNGYAVLVPNVRGSTGYGKAYSHLDDVERRMDSVADLAYAARWLKSRPEIDPDRLAVYGGSYGGFMVLATLTTNPELWAAGVDIVGISNLATFLENTSEYRRAQRAAEYGSLARDRDFLESIAPINHVDRIQTPLIVIHGANDPRVPLSEAQQLVSALEARGVPVQFLVFDDEGHGIVKLKNKLVSFPAIVSFLDTHIKGS